MHSQDGSTFYYEDIDKMTIVLWLIRLIIIGNLKNTEMNFSPISATKYINLFGNLDRKYMRVSFFVIEKNVDDGICRDQQ